MTTRRLFAFNPLSPGLAALLALLALALPACDKKSPPAAPPATEAKPPAPPATATAPATTGPATTEPATQAADPEGWKSLFDGKTLTGWKVPDFGGSGKVHVKDGCLHLEMGEMCTGVAYTGKVPREDYEVSLEMMRQDGNDFPCALTFPVGKDPLTFVIGGWGGTVTGVSCVDGYDASDNQFSKFFELANKKWYKVMVRVTKEAVECFIDGKQFIDINRSEHKFSIRAEVEECTPLGIATWRTYGVIRNIKVRTLD